MYIVGQVVYVKSKRVHAVVETVYPFREDMIVVKIEKDLYSLRLQDVSVPLAPIPVPAPVMVLE